MTVSHEFCENSMMVKTCVHGNQWSGKELSFLTRENEMKNVLEESDGSLTFDKRKEKESSDSGHANMEFLALLRKI